MPRRVIAAIGVIVLSILIIHQGSPVRSQDAGLTPVAYLPIVDKYGPTLTPTPTETPTLTPSNTPTITNTPTNTATPTNTPTPSNTPTPTVTPTTGVFPSPDPPCDQNAPGYSDGAVAWMTVPNPPRFSNTTVCARLSLNGAVQGAYMHAVAHYKTTNTDLGTSFTGADGVAKSTFSIGGATSGYTVIVDVDITWNGQTYHTSTAFTPQ